MSSYNEITVSIQALYDALGPNNVAPFNVSAGFNIGEARPAINRRDDKMTEDVYYIHQIQLYTPWGLNVIKQKHNNT